jgi:hypothetical protein
VAKISTREHDGDVVAFLDSVADDRRRADAHAALALFERVTGTPAKMWGASMVGFGSMPYTNTTGTNDWPVVAFSPRKAALTIYGIHDGYGPEDPLLGALGPHTTGKGCVYIKRLDDVDASVLEQLVAGAWRRAESDAPEESTPAADS